MFSGDGRDDDDGRQYMTTPSSCWHDFARKGPTASWQRPHGAGWRERLVVVKPTRAAYAAAGYWCEDVRELAGASGPEALQLYLRRR